MDSKSRMLKAWNFEEPDRVPIEVALYFVAEGLPGADEIKDFEENEADNFKGVDGFDWGFLGLDSVCTEEVIEDVPGDFKRILRTQSTSVGDFTAITKHNYDDVDKGDFHWDKRYIETVDDFRLIAEAERAVRPFDLEKYNQGCAEIGDRGLPQTHMMHPLGTLVRSSNMEEIYMWMLAEEELTMKFLERCNNQVADSILSIADKPLAEAPIFGTGALEMLTPPWMGKNQFDKFVFPFDKFVNDAIHKIGGRHRAHCHGNSGEFLERFADMGIDGVEPLEPPPYGDNILADAKKRVGDRMLLSGNVPSQTFHHPNIGPKEVREYVRDAIKVGAPGGGFFLKTTGSLAGTGKTKEQATKDIQCYLAFIEAWREFGSY